MVAFVTILVALIAALVVIGGRGGGDDRIPPAASEPAMNRIVYVDSQGQIRTIDPDGLNEVTITPEEGLFAWPSWSPDSTRISFSALVRKPDGQAALEIYVAEGGAAKPQLAYANEPGTTVIAQGVPHYSLWSPDGRRIAFIASTPDALTLFMDDRRTLAGPEEVLRSAPLWMAWSSNSRYLLVHGGIDHFLVDTEDGNAVTVLSVRSDGYRVPAWRPSAEEMTFIMRGSNGAYSLQVDPIDSNEPTLIQQTPPGSAFLWSPDGSFLGVARPAVLGSTVHSRLDLISADGAAQGFDMPGGLLAFFWAPDGSKLAYVRLTDLTRTSGVLQWVVLDVISGVRRPLVEFIPSFEQLTMFQFFDQYAYSHSIWSPDSSSIVFAGRLWTRAIMASLGQQLAPQIYVVDVDGVGEAKTIAEGVQGFWSPR